MVQLNLLLYAFVTVFLLRAGVELFLNGLNLSHLHRCGATVPILLRDSVDEETLRKMSGYASESTRFTTVAGLANQALTLGFLLSGFLPWLVKRIESSEWGAVTHGLLFFAALSLLANALRLPFSLYETFVIEARYGFNTKSLRIWLADLLKGIVLVTLLAGGLLWLLLNLVVHGGGLWWVWAWVVVGGYELVMLWLYPILIAPWFNTFEPVEDPSLRRQIERMMEKMNLRAKGVFKMDASRRSRHTNAYFTGFGRGKRIVLYDTLLASHREDEVLAVLGHEIGHWKKKHILKQVAALEILSFGLFYLVSKGLEWPTLYQTFGFEAPVVYAGLFLVSAVLSPLGAFVQPVESAVLRRFEREADDFVVALLGTAAPMQGALKRLAKDNLANLTPHPLYTWFYDSHPPLVERIARLRGPGETGQEAAA